MECSAVLLVTPRGKKRKQFLETKKIGAFQKRRRNLVRFVTFGKLKSERGQPKREKEKDCATGAPARTLEFFVEQEQKLQEEEHSSPTEEDGMRCSDSDESLLLQQLPRAGRREAVKTKEHTYSGRGTKHKKKNWGSIIIVPSVSIQ